MQFLNILVIDDMEPVLNVLKDGLTAYGHTVFAALSGEDGIEIFRTKPINAVLCDLGLGGMNGWQVAKCVQNICLETNRSRPPFVIVTGWAHAEEEEAPKMLECGVDRIVQKPIMIRDLLEIISQLLDSRAQDSVISQQSIPPLLG